LRKNQRVLYRTLLISALAAAAISIPAAATGAPNVTLTGVVGPATNISLKNADGSNVTHLDPGTYDISVTDNSIEHNFHLIGPGSVDRATEVETTGTTTWTVTFTDGTYRFQCDPHASFMRGSFTVGNVPPPPPPPGKLSGKVTARAITLMNGGSRVVSLVENTFKLTVNDTSKKQNFHLTGPGVNKKTGAAARTKVTWTVTLKPGKYTYRSDKNRRLRRTFTVRERQPIP
jgi:Copper binding proteins, plastocyanin/azurin family